MFICRSCEASKLNKEALDPGIFIKNAGNTKFDAMPLNAGDFFTNAYNESGLLEKKINYKQSILE